MYKPSISLKELRESRSWTRPIAGAELLPQRKPGNLPDECEQMCAVLGRSVVTAKQNGSWFK